MAVFTVHMRETPASLDLVLVKDGFSVWAALFSFLWAFCVGAWELALAFIVFQVVMGAVLPILFENLASLAMVQMGLAILMGLVANEGRRVFLTRRGCGEVGVVTGPNKIEAERRFLDTHPDLAAALLGAS
ncbi:MAG: DUF2628 domain-containing protein [Magnetovibrio sp.]|nr:DUF2628 domain-containing protein [Magnetovibrio sp.]